MSPTVFMHDDFLLQSKSASRLYHDYAEQEPIVDYHCHLPPSQVAEDTRFSNMAHIWLAGDHYKWRLMRTCGIAEKFCTGNASDFEKFMAWAQTVPKGLRNPLYHWTHLELKSPFGITDRVFNPQTAQYIWDACNEKLAQPGFSARGIMTRMNVKLVCTTDDPIDSLEHHIAVAADASFKPKMYPTFRPDKSMAVDMPELFNSWIDKLEAVSGIPIHTFADFIVALRQRHDFFHTHGCRLSDHGIETAYGEPFTETGVAKIFTDARGRKTIDPKDVLVFKSAMMHEFGIMNAEKGWTMQLHMNAMRNNNTRMFKSLGPDTGYDSIGDLSLAYQLSRFLDGLESIGKLPKTILYNLNPSFNAVLGTMLGNFQDGSTAGKIQFGSAWWFLDNKPGMEEQIQVLSSLGSLACFVGMLTDSRSFLSYPRHEYFRRILCNILGDDIEKGLIPQDFELVGSMVKDISCGNAVRYFGFGD